MNFLSRCAAVFFMLPKAARNGIGRQEKKGIRFSLTQPIPFRSVHPMTNQQARVVSAARSKASAPAETECPRCQGYGYTMAHKARVAMANDRRSKKCEECGGTGQVQS
jgi:DnaJ-class molecular chaperone